LLLDQKISKIDKRSEKEEIEERGRERDPRMPF
jgi:hypothetical protein